MNTPMVTATSAAKAANRDAKPAYFPCRLSRMTTGRPELVEADGLAADNIEHIARDAAGGSGDNGTEVGLR